MRHEEEGAAERAPQCEGPAQLVRDCRLADRFSQGLAAALSINPHFSPARSLFRFRYTVNWHAVGR
jgi:hypothetical protein